jgi:hypothetical protein
MDGSNRDEAIAMRWASWARDSAQLLTELAWVTVAGAMVAVLIGAQSNPVPLWIGVMVGAAGFGLRRFFVPDAAPVASAKFLMVGAGGLTLYIGISLLPGVGLDFAWPLHVTKDWQEARHVILGGILMMVLWLRGTTLGQEEASVFSMAQSFRVGVGVVVAGVVAHILLPVSIGATPATFLFFGAGMAGFALTHIVSMGPQDSSGLNDWPKTAALTVGGILVGSIVLALIAEGDVGRVIASVFRLGLAVLTPVVIVLAWALGMVVEVTTYAFLYLISFLRENSEPVTFTPTTPNFSNVDTSESGSIVPFWILRFLSWSAVLIAISGVAYILWRSFVQRPLRDRDQEGEERERLDAEGDLGADLAEALASIIGRFGRRKGSQSGFRPMDANDPRSVALGAYQNLLVLAADRGLTRLPSQTPEEFETSLTGSYPASEVSALTRAFTRARYGFIAPTESETLRIREAWARLRAPADDEQVDSGAKI